MAGVKQEPPFCVQVELTEGCNLRCDFCGVNGIRGVERTYKYMTPQVARKVADAIFDGGWRNPRLEFAMHGEPSLNKMAVQIIKIFRARFPKASLMMLSNGGGLVGKEGVDFLDGLFDAGLNTLGLDEYEGISLVPRFLDHWRAAREDSIPIHVYPDDPKVSPHTPQRPGSRRIIHIRPITVSKTGTHDTLNNHCGAGAPLNDNGIGKRCAKPFRELSVRWDGGVAICCNDWRGALPLGNLAKDTLASIWDGPIIQAARRKLYHGVRDFGPCKGCDAVSYRVGLLPDKMGKLELPKPTKKDNELLAMARKPMAKTVKREWE